LSRGVRFGRRYAALGDITVRLTFDPAIRKKLESAADKRAMSVTGLKQLINVAIWEGLLDAFLDDERLLAEVAEAKRRLQERTQKNSVRRSIEDQASA
jgi:hypothetical protein